MDEEMDFNEQLVFDDEGKVRTIPKKKEPEVCACVVCMDVLVSVLVCLCVSLSFCVRVCVLPLLGCMCTLLVLRRRGSGK